MSETLTFISPIRFELKKTVVWIAEMQRGKFNDINFNSYAKPDSGPIGILCTILELIAAR